MKKLLTLSIIVLFIFSTFSVFTPQVKAEPTMPRIFIDPPSSSASVGEFFTININVADVADLIAWQFRLDWDAGILDFVSISEGPFLKGQPEGTFFAYETEQDSIGTDYIVAICATLGNWPGVYGSGTLATVTFLVEDIGETTLHFHNPYPAEPTDTGMLNSNSVYIDFTAEDGYFYTPFVIPNHPPNPPSYLFQYRADGTEIPVGGTIFEDTVTLLGVVSDPDNDRVKLQIELRRLDEYDGNFIGIPTHESEFVDSDSIVTITIYGLIPGSYHWQARTVDEYGLVSDWADFGNNDISETDFAVATEIVFRPPYRLSSKSGWSESHLLGKASYYSEVDPSVGNGKIMARAKVTFGGYGEALAAFTLGDYWRNDWSGTATIAATFNITGLIMWAKIFFPKYFTQVYLGVNLKASLWIYDHSSSTEIWRKDLIIYEKKPEWKVISLSESDAVTYSDTQYVIQGFVDLQKDHAYSWYFEAQIWSRVDVSGFGTAVAGGNMATEKIDRSIELIDVRIGPPVLRPEPEPIVTAENVMYVAVGSPVDVLVADPEGRRIGFDFTSQQEVNEIPDAVYTGPGSEPQVIAIPDPLDGDYVVLLIGTATGTYSVTTELILLEETITQTYTGDIMEGKILEYIATVSETDVTATSPVPPVLVDKIFKPNKMSLKRLGAVMSRTNITNTGYLDIDQITYQDEILDGWTVPDFTKPISVTLFVSGTKYKIPYEELTYVAIENGKYIVQIDFNTGIDLYQYDPTLGQEVYATTIYALEPGWIIEIKYPMLPPTTLQPGEYLSTVSIVATSPEGITIKVEDTAVLTVNT